MAEDNNELVALSVVEISRNYMSYPASPYYVVLFCQRILTIPIDIQLNYLSVSSRLQVPFPAIGFWTEYFPVFFQAVAMFIFGREVSTMRW